MEITFWNIPSLWTDQPFQWITVRLELVVLELWQPKDIRDIVIVKEGNVFI